MAEYTIDELMNYWEQETEYLVWAGSPNNHVCET